MRYKYVFGVNVITENILPSAKEVVDSVNSFMKGFGFDEKITLRSKMDIYTITSNRLLKDEELRIIEREIVNTCGDIIAKLGTETYLEYRPL